MFEQAFKNVDDVLWKDAGCTSELDYTEQSSWLLFLKYLDALEADKATEAKLDGKKYDFILDKQYRWPSWAAPKGKDGKIDHNVALTGDDLTAFVNGKLLPYLVSGVRLITAKNVKMGYLQESPMEFIALDDYNGWMTRGIPRKGDVLFTTEAPLANVAQLDTDEKVAFAQRVIIMQANAAKLDSAFLKYLLLSRPVQQRIRTQGTGATVQGIKASLLKLIAISFPKTLDEQRRIVAELDELTEETERLEGIYQQKLTALAALQKSLLHQAFTGQL